MKSLIIPDSVLVSLHASSKKQVLQELSHKAASLLDMPEREILEALMEREKLGSTGIGKGIAIPHCRLPGLTRFLPSWIPLWSSNRWTANRLTLSSC